LKKEQERRDEMMDLMLLDEMALKKDSESEINLNEEIKKYLKF
jgi:hypothetical protein